MLITISQTHNTQHTTSQVLLHLRRDQRPDEEAAEAHGGREAGP